MFTRAFFKPSFTRGLNSTFRRYSATAKTPREEYFEELERTQRHAAESVELWRKIFLYVCIPAIALVSYNAKRLMDEHEEHMKHHPREWVPYAYLNVRNKPFPWGDSGDHGLFYNPKVNIEP